MVSERGGRLNSAVYLNTLVLREAIIDYILCGIEKSKGCGLLQHIQASKQQSQWLAMLACEERNT